LLAGCDRAFVPVVPPDVRVVEPDDLDLARTADSLDLVVEATSFRAVVEVRVDGEAFSRVGDSDRWRGRIALETGLNAIPLVARDRDGVEGVDTVFAYRLALRPSAQPDLPAPRGGLTVTRLPNGALLAAGGADASGTAQNEAWLLAEGAQQWQPVPGGLVQARAGHTATLLADGRVLLMGGSRTDVPTGLDDLVEQAEAYDPLTGRFAVVPVDGAPILRAWHTAFLRAEQGVPVAELVGGRGNIDFLPNRRFGVRDDLRSFAVRAEGLDALLPSGLTGQGQPIEPVEGHATVQIGTPERPVWRTAGVALTSDGPFRQAFALEASGDRLRFAQTPLPRVGRFRAAYAPGLAGEMWTIGGQASRDGTLAPGADLFVQAARRAFGVDLEAGSYGAAAYAEPGGGVCWVGGFDASGTSLMRHVCYRKEGR
jgi:hypothetical protein